MSVRALIVEDEPLARETVRDLLARDAAVTVVGECDRGASAVAAIRRHRPDLVFLDVQMPDLDGFAVLERVAAEHVPLVVFITAYDRYAVRAFDVHAVDYLLKPFDDARFARALARAKRALDGRSRERRARSLSALLDSRGTQPAPRFPRHLVVRSGRGLVFVRLDDVDRIAAADYYVQLHVGARTHLLRETLDSLEARLDPAEFVRIHRSTIVRADRVREIGADRAGRPCVVLVDGTRLRLSRAGQRKRLERLLGRGGSASLDD